MVFSRVFLVLVSALAVSGCATGGGPSTLTSTAASTSAKDGAYCADPGYRQLDFWLGDWDVTWKDTETGTSGSGRNRITRTLGGCVIEERFDGGADMPLRGVSLSTYHRNAEEWRQLWLDNEGGYLPFKGGPVGEDFILKIVRKEDGDPQRRMVFEDIKAGSLTWRWQKRDGEGPWLDLLVMAYARRGGTS